MNVDHSATDEFLMHHGIKGMKWGVRRSPQQLGHAVAKKVPSGEKKVKKPTITKNDKKNHSKYEDISNEELQSRIDRLNLQERYADLISKQKKRYNTGFKAWAKEQGIKSLESFGEQTLQWAVNKAVDKITKRNGKKFDIDDYKDVDVSKMDSDTIAKVSKWYIDAANINARRKAPTANESDSKETSKKKDEDSKPKANESKPKDSGSSDAPKANESRLSNTSGSSSNGSRSTKVPWIYSASGTAYKKEAERIAKDRRNRDKDILKWLI